MTTQKSRALPVFGAAIIVMFLIGSSDALNACTPNMGAIVCGDIINPTGYAVTTHIFEFQASEGDILAFTGVHMSGGGTLELAVQDTTCGITFMSDGDYLSTEKATICPFVAPETTTYMLRVIAAGRRFVPFAISMICLNSADECATVPVKERTWGHIKMLYQ